MSYATIASSPKPHPLRQNRLNRVKDKTKKARPSMRTSFLGTLVALAESENGAQACLSKRVLVLDILSGHKRHRQFSTHDGFVSVHTRHRSV